MSFLPNKYKVPVSGGNYYKLADGENTFRILSSAIIGWEYWTTNNKPVRSRTKFEEQPADIRIEKNGNVSKVKHFWSFIVWDYQDKAIKIMEITQQTIQTAIKALVDNKKWGDPKGYDISITKKGDGLDTEYTTMPNPHSIVEDTIKDAFMQKTINLEALYDGGDPFNSGKSKEQQAEEVFGVNEEMPI